MLALAAAAALFVAARSWRSDGEDFVYYYCAGVGASVAGSPYDPAPYQGCVGRAYGRANPNASRDAGSAYPPAAMPLFRALAHFSYPTAFALWNALLLLVTAALLAGLRGVPEDALLLALWPGFVLCWTYHKLSLALFGAALAGLGLVEQGREAAGGVALGLLALQPQWLAALGLYVAARGRFRALAAAAATAAALMLVGWRAGWFSQWLVSAATHADVLISYDNQSLFVALDKPLLAHGVFFPSVRSIRAFRYALTLCLAAFAWRRARRPDGLGPFLGLMLLAQPYTHASDALWAFPFFLYLRDRAAARHRWRGNAPTAAALAAIALAWLFFLYGPGESNRIALENREGYLALALALAWLAVEVHGKSQTLENS